MKQDFGGVIWTNHAIQRMRERGISQGDAWVAFNRPEQSRKQSKRSGQATAGAWVFYRNFGNQRIEVVGKKNEEGKWVVLSVWSRQLRDKKASASSGQGIFVRLIRKLFGM